MSSYLSSAYIAMAMAISFENARIKQRKKHKNRRKNNGHKFKRQVQQNKLKDQKEKGGMHGLECFIPGRNKLKE